MVNIDTLIEQTRVLAADLDKLKKEQMVSKDIEKNQIESIRKLAKSHPINNIELVKADQFTRKLYLTALCAVANQEKDTEIKMQMLVFVGRLVAGFDKEVDILKYTIHAMQIDVDFMNDFMENIKDECAKAFSIDAIIIMNLSKENRTELTEYVLEYMDIFDFDKDVVQDICKVGKSIVEQNIGMLFEHHPEYIYHCMPYYSDTSQIQKVNALETIHRKSKYVLIKGICFKEKEVSEDAPYGERLKWRNLNLDKHQGKELIFWNCTFRYTRIVSQLTNVSFVNCNFEINEKRIRACLPKRQDIFSRSVNTVNVQPYMTLKNAKLIRCCIKNTEESISDYCCESMKDKFILLKLTNCVIKDCIIDNIPAKKLLDFDENTISKDIKIIGEN